MESDYSFISGEYSPDIVWDYNQDQYSMEGETNERMVTVEDLVNILYRGNENRVHHVNSRLKKLEDKQVDGNIVNSTPPNYCSARYHEDAGEVTEFPKCHIVAKGKSHASKLIETAERLQNRPVFSCLQIENSENKNLSKFDLDMTICEKSEGKMNISDNSSADELWGNSEESDAIMLEALKCYEELERMC